MPVEIPIHPPEEWFSPPEDGIPTDRRITIQADGRVFGYIALWNTCHVGMKGCVTPPKGSPSGYEYAHQGETLTASGKIIKTAVIGGGAGHAPVDMHTANVPAYYENIDTQLMRVRYGQDENGLYFAGALWPTVSELQVAHIRASSVSGDWRWHAAWRKSGGDYDFAGACFVNIPGFPMPVDGDNNEGAGTPYALAASAYIPVKDGDDYIFMDGETMTASAEGDDTLSCNGNKEECGCTQETCTSGDSEVDVQASAADDAVVEDDDVSDEDIIAAIYQLVGKRRKKNGSITADASEDVEEAEEAVDTSPTVQELAESIQYIKNAVDWLVSDKLVEDIAQSVDEQ